MKTTKNLPQLLLVLSLTILLTACLGNTKNSNPTKSALNSPKVAAALSGCESNSNEDLIYQATAWHYLINNRLGSFTKIADSDQWIEITSDGNTYKYQQLKTEYCQYAYITLWDDTRSIYINIYTTNASKSADKVNWLPYANGEIATPIANDAARTRWTYRQGRQVARFEKVANSSNWQQHSISAAVYALQQQVITNDFVQLYDQERNYYFRLYADHAEYSKNGELWTRLTNGQWNGSSADLLGAIVGDARIYWQYSSAQGIGNFSKTDNGWQETQANGTQYTQSETTRNEQYIQIYDSKRAMAIRLYPKHAEYLQRRSNSNWLRLYSGQWKEKPSNNQRNKWYMANGNTRGDVYIGEFIRGRDGRNWRESKLYGNPISYAQVASTDEYIEIFDQLRNISLRLYDDRIEKSTDKTSWQKLASGGWSASKPSSGEITSTTSYIHQASYIHQNVMFQKLANTKPSWPLYFTDTNWVDCSKNCVPMEIEVELESKKLSYLDPWICGLPIPRDYRCDPTYPESFALIPPAQEGKGFLRGGVDLPFPVISASSRIEQNIKLTWEEVAGATFYRVYENNNLLGEYTGLMANITSADLTLPDSCHLFIVQACNANGCSPNFAARTFGANIPGGVESLACDNWYKSAE